MLQTQYNAPNRMHVFQNISGSDRTPFWCWDEESVPPLKNPGYASAIALTASIHEHVLIMIIVIIQYLEFDVLCRFVQVGPYSLYFTAFWFGRAVI